MTALAFDSAPVAEAARLGDTAHWVAKLRWVAAVGQLLTVAVVNLVFRVPVLWLPLGTLIGVTFVSNAIFAWWLSRRRRCSPRQWRAALGSVMLLDLVVLTAMLYFSGGPTNPFVIFFFVNVALSGVVLTPKWAWLLNGVAIGAVVTLALWHQPMAELREAERLLPVMTLPHIPAATLGGLVAFVACSTVIVAFTTRLTAEARENDRLRRRAEELRSRSEKLEALGTLAAGAAHELATPLSTIAVVTTQMQSQLLSDAPADRAAAQADAELIRSELERCRTILDRMSLKAGQAVASDVRQVTVAELMEAMQSELPDSGRVKLNWAGDAATARLQAVPVESLAQALRALVTNALDASPPDQPVRLKLAIVNAKLRLEINDSGAGMSPEVAARAGEPFFTTKPAGKGMGLGLFLARSVIERLAGALSITSQPGHGATALVELPLQAT